MQGIEILNKTSIETKPLWAWILLFVCIAVGVFAYLIYEDNLSTTEHIISGIIVIVCIVCGIYALVYSVPTGRCQYEAIIQDDTSINEVYKYYNVIDQKGKKWILEDKETENE